MATDRRKEAIARRDRLREELQKIEQYLALHDQLFGEEAPQPANRPAKPPEMPAAAPAPEPMPAREQKLIEGQEEFNEVARRLLLARGRPATRGEFIEMLHQHGYEVAGDDPKKNTGTKLWRARGVIVHLEQGYWVLDTACPAVGYKPPRPKLDGWSANNSIPDDGVETRPHGGSRRLQA